jgi:hypothetical protein
MTEPSARRIASPLVSGASGGSWRNRMSDIVFEEFPKIARLSRDCVITEKLDGTNAQVLVTETGEVIAGSRSRFLTVDADNFGFAAWARKHADELRELGPGRHFGEWYGQGIQRTYGLTTRRFALFNVARWGESRPACCDVVPVLYRGVFDTFHADEAIDLLRRDGSRAAPGFMRPEGIVVWHEAARVGFKKTLERDEERKSQQKAPTP